MKLLISALLVFQVYSSSVLWYSKPDSTDDDKCTYIASVTGMSGTVTALEFAKTAIMSVSNTKSLSTTDTGIQIDV